MTGYVPKRERYAWSDADLRVHALLDSIVFLKPSLARVCAKYGVDCGFLDDGSVVVDPDVVFRVAVAVAEKLGLIPESGRYRESGVARVYMSVYGRYMVFLLNHRCRGRSGGVCDGALQVYGDVDYRVYECGGGYMVEYNAGGVRMVYECPDGLRGVLQSLSSSLRSIGVGGGGAGAGAGVEEEEGGGG